MSTSRTHPRGMTNPLQVDINRDPIVVFWEVTLACALACRHCRAQAQPKRHPLELNTVEGFRILDELASFDHPPIVVLSGGDPFMRRDLFELVEYGKRLDLSMSVAPSATALVTRERLQRLKELGVSRISLSLDGSNAQAHDDFRGVNGSFQRTLDAMATSADVGLEFQINTTITRRTLADLPQIAELLAASGTVLWDLFFLVPMGRAQSEDVISAEDHERVFNWLCDLSSTAPFQVKTTLGMHYRRVQLQRRLAEQGLRPEELTSQQVRELYRGVPSNDGKGIMFISHLGEVLPSGFLPIPSGNARRDSLVELYRESPLFKSLRDPRRLKGKCKRCPFNVICGGSRARAYAMTGDPLQAEPCCVFQPASPNA